MERSVHEDGNGRKADNQEHTQSKTNSLTSRKLDFAVLFGVLPVAEVEGGGCEYDISLLVVGSIDDVVDESTGK